MVVKNSRILNDSSGKEYTPATYAMLENRTMKYFCIAIDFISQEINCIVLSSNMACVTGVYSFNLAALYEAHFPAFTTWRIVVDIYLVSLNSSGYLPAPLFTNVVSVSKHVNVQRV